MGVGILSWSADGEYLVCWDTGFEQTSKDFIRWCLSLQLSRNDNMPNTLWLWDMNKLRLAAMIGTTIVSKN
jgi:hypothetical protein